MALAVIGSLGVVPAAAEAAVTVTTTPSLAPKFSTTVSDYVTTCPGNRVTVVASSTSASPIKIDRSPSKSGRQNIAVSLRPGQRFEVVVGKAPRSTVHSIRCVPADFPAFQTTGKLPASIPFFAMSAPDLSVKPIPYAIVVNANGVPVWWKETPGSTPIDVKFLSGRRIGFWRGALNDREESDGVFSVYGFNGVKQRDVNVTEGKGDLHDSLPTSRGTFYRISAVYLDNFDLTAFGGGPANRIIGSNLQEIDSSGNVIWQWNSQDHIGLAETGWRWWLALGIRPVKPPWDVTHINSIDEDGHGGVVISARHKDAIYRINKADGSITWKLGGSPTSKSLTVLGDAANAAHLGGEHDARVQPDGTITVYDNGSGLGRPPRALRWRIDTAAKTATLIEQITDPAIRLSAALGSARRMSDGAWLISWTTYPWVKAYNKDHKQLFALKLVSNGRAYRAAPATPDLATRSELVAGMDAQYPR